MNEATQRLFFAVWPDAATSNALATLAQQVAVESGGRPTAPGNVHLTLAFLGDQPRRIARELSAAAARISAPSFDLVLDSVDSWRKNAIAWAGVQSVPPPLMELQQKIARSLSVSGLEAEERPFAVHVTLARRITVAVRHPLAPPLVWHVTAFALVVSEPDVAGARYRVLSSWPLLQQPRNDREGPK
jgi:RNA 2',3'-cyclic 3'-phosphodiesterase